MMLNDLWWRERPLLRALAEALEGGDEYQLDAYATWARAPRNPKFIRAFDVNGARYEITKDTIWDLAAPGIKAELWPLDELLLCVPGLPLTFISSGREMTLGVIVACDR